MVIKYFDGKVPEVPVELGLEPNPLAELAEGIYERYAACMSDIDFCGAAATVMELLHRANLYVEDSAPWNLAKSEETQGDLAFVLYNALETCRISALLLAPFMPATSTELWRRLSLGDPCAVDDAAELSLWGGLPAGNQVEKGDALFPRLDK